VARSVRPQAAASNAARERRRVKGRAREKIAQVLASKARPFGDPEHGAKDATPVAAKQLSSATDGSHTSASTQHRRSQIWAPDKLQKLKNKKWAQEDFDE
jgi:hypothetical protein